MATTPIKMQLPHFSGACFELMWGCVIDADLGGFLYKKRVARPGGGYVFLHGFPKSGMANITQDEKKSLQFAGKVFLDLSAKALLKALQSGV